MAEDQHTQERRQDEDRWRWAFGILVTIGIFTGAQLIGGLIWGGRITAQVETVQREIAAAAAELSAQEARLREVENARAGAASELVALRRDWTEFRIEARENFADIAEKLDRIYRNGSGNQ